MSPPGRPKGEHRSAQHEGRPATPGRKAKAKATRQFVPGERQVFVDLALQGGGSHGAFTWGVLDRLLEEPWLCFDGIWAAAAFSATPNSRPMATFQQYAAAVVVAASGGGTAAGAVADNNAPATAVTGSLPGAATGAIIGATTTGQAG